MDTSNVSALDQDTYQLIATNTTTSGATSTFSGLSGYKKYIVAFEGVSISASANIVLTFNGSTSNYWGGVTLAYSTNFQNGTSGIKLNWTTFTTGNNGIISIDNINNGAPKIVKGELVYGNDYICDIRGGWTQADSITSITFTLASGAFSAGSMKLYGIAG